MTFQLTLRMRTLQSAYAARTLEGRAIECRGRTRSELKEEEKAAAAAARAAQDRFVQSEFRNVTTLCVSLFGCQTAGYVHVALLSNMHIYLTSSGYLCLRGGMQTGRVVESLVFPYPNYCESPRGERQIS